MVNVKGYKVQQVATQTEAVIFDEDEHQKSSVELLVEIANDVRVLKEKLVGK